MAKGFILIILMRAAVARVVKVLVFNLFLSADFELQIFFLSYINELPAKKNPFSGDFFAVRFGKLF